MKQGGTRQVMALVALTCLPGGLLAQEIIFDPGLTVSCIAADPGEECIGLSANNCIERSGEGLTTVSVVSCIDHELEWWDDRLNAVYQNLKARLTELDAGKPGYAPSRVEALKDMQRAWIPYRDAVCLFEAAEWGGGTKAGPATVRCLMHETALRALYLERRFQE